MCHYDMTKDLTNVDLIHAKLLHFVCLHFSFLSPWVTMLRANFTLHRLLFKKAQSHAMFFNVFKSVLVSILIQNHEI